MFKMVAQKVEELRLKMIAPPDHPEAGKVVQVDKTVIEGAEGIIQLVGKHDVNPGDVIRITVGAPVIGQAPIGPISKA